MRIIHRIIRTHKKMKQNGFWKELGMTVLATTISIALTFGTAQLIENNKNKQNGRKAVMTVINDMDSFIATFHGFAKDEERHSDIAKYVVSHIDSIEYLSKDTLTDMLDYLKYRSLNRFDDTNEKIFQSSQDTWKNIDNMTVINLIQNFYRERSEAADYINTTYYFTRPISNEDVYEILLKSQNHVFNYPLIIEVLRKALQEDKTQLYLAYAPSRQDFYNKIANSWQRISDQCKFMMNISDEEMEEYVEETSRTGSHLTKKKLVGKWIVTSTDETDKETIEFRPDNTFAHTKYKAKTSTLYSGQLITKYTLPGHWEIKGDSLIREYEVGAHYDMDTSGLSYTPEMADSVEHMIERWQKQIDEYNETRKTESVLGRKANVAYIDKSGNKIEFQSYTINDDGEEEDITYYIVREK